MINTESKLEKLFKQGEFVVTAEIGPPKHASAHTIIHHAEMLKNHIDASNITDCQMAVVRLSSIAAAVHSKRVGIDPIAQMTCRDRNRIAIQSDLLGAYSLGVRNVLCPWPSPEKKWCRRSSSVRGFSRGRRFNFFGKQNSYQFVPGGYCF